MKRPWHVWLAFGCCAALVAAAMGWLTLHALRTDRERSEALVAADLEQRISLALWRMDTKLAPLIAKEITRPHFLYDPYIVFEPPKSKGDATEDRVASPLLTGSDANVILNFVATADGVWESPQAPPPELTAFACANGMTLDQIESNRTRLVELARHVEFVKLLAELPEQTIASADASNAIAGALDAVESLARDDPNQRLLYLGNDAAIPAAESERGDPQQRQLLDSERGEFGGGMDGMIGGYSSANQQAAAKGRDGRDGYGGRGSRLQEQVSDEMLKQQAENVFRMRGNNARTEPVVESISRPLWVGDQLLLARRVTRGESTMIQGSWLNWTRIKSDLLTETADLLPDADLVPVRAGEKGDPTRMLAGLPVRLVAFLAPAKAVTAVTPLRWALGVGWIALGLALAAVAGLLWGVMALSERRAAFVSSVTHELRTPLTTFRMYAEMLARDMVPTAQRRREYLETLRTEAERLTHLVDNVLAYARLERGRNPRRSEQTTPARLVERFESRLVERLTAAGMTLENCVDPDVADATLLTDIGVVEQILFNLVDNSAKYAARASNRRVHLGASRNGRFATFQVRDHGPGFISPSAAEHSAPFSKTAEQAAESAPGVGLGLALCRRLARELGGQLVVAPRAGEPGATVSLQLPIES
jgi:signal transduction histidine kinase